MQDAVQWPPLGFGWNDSVMLQHFYLPHRKARLFSQFRLGQVGLNALQQQVIAQSFGIDWNQLSGAIFLIGMIKFNHYRPL